MTPSPLRVLIVEDSTADAELVVRALRQGGLEPLPERVDTAEAMRAALDRQPWDIVLCDYSMPSFDAPSALAQLRERAQDVPFIVVSGSVGEDTAVAAMQAGATDYIMKDRLQRLAPAVVRAVEGAAVWRERRRLEEALGRAQKMEAVGRLAGGVAHDFNNVLTAIIGSVELLMLDVPPGAKPREELEIIRDASEHARDLIRRLLAFSARQVLQPTVLDLNRLVGDLGKLLRRMIGEDVELTTALGPELGTVRVDAGQMEQVLVNLALNARDAMPRGGRLTIETADVELPGALDPPAPDVPSGRYVMLSVTDTGVGMDRETAAHMFEPFFTTKARGKGTGLGLATVYGIVHQSGGHIAVDSGPGRGTTFRIFLPCSPEPEAAADRAPPAAAPAGGTETVLVVEDEPLVRILARKILEQAGYRVLVAASGTAALQLAEQHDGAIHLLLTDVVMPEMSGRELVRRLTERLSDVRVVYMSGYADEAVDRPFIQKPFTRDELARVVREALDAPV